MATYAYVNPLVAILLGVLFAGETLTVWVVLSALIIIGSVVLINYAGDRRGARREYGHTSKQV